MTLRRKLTTGALTGAVLLGALAFDGGSVSAAPVIEVHIGSYALGDDPLAGYAGRALTAWDDYSRSGDGASADLFNSMRDGIAAEAARRLELNPAEMQAAWAAADDVHQVALLAAVSQLGTPYRRNTSNPGVGFDCSGLTTFAWGQAGVTLTRQSTSQINQAARRNRDTAEAGDLVQYPGHVMIYLGVGDAIIHAPYTGRSVEFSSIPGRRSGSVRFGDPTG